MSQHLQHGKRTILFLAANPKDTPSLRLSQEQRDIEDALTRSNNRDDFFFKSRPAMRTDDLRRGILDMKPEIVHFCGHAGKDGIYCEDEQGKSKLISPPALFDIFQACSDHVKCVILNACLTKDQANEISKSIDYVIGMDGKIGDRAAIQFAKGFYDALGAGETFEKSYRMGISALQLEKIPEDAVPVLKKKGGLTVTVVSPNIRQQKSSLLSSAIWFIVGFAACATIIAACNIYKLIDFSFVNQSVAALDVAGSVSDGLGSGGDGKGSKEAASSAKEPGRNDEKKGSKGGELPSKEPVSIIESQLRAILLKNAKFDGGQIRETQRRHADRAADPSYDIQLEIRDVNCEVTKVNIENSYQATVNLTANCIFVEIYEDRRFDTRIGSVAIVAIINISGPNEYKIIECKLIQPQPIGLIHFKKIIEEEIKLHFVSIFTIRKK